MTPLDYYTSFIWVKKQGDKTIYEDERTGKEFDSKPSMAKHCKAQAKDFDSEVQTEL